MAKEEGETPEEEYDELWDRVTANITDWSGIYSKQDLINKIHKEYPLSIDPKHIIYEKMAADTRGGEKIQSTVSDFIEKEVEEPEKTLTTDDNAIITEAGKLVFTEAERNLLLDQIGEIIDKKIGKQLIAKGVEKKYREPVERKIAERTPGYKAVEEQVQAQIRIAIDRPTKEVYRIKRMVRSGEYTEALEEFEKGPKRAKDVADALYGKYLLEPGKPLNKDTIRRDTSELNIKGYIEPTAPPKIGQPIYYRLTAKGKSTLNKLRGFR
jgi:hypothetical protein